MLPGTALDPATGDPNSLGFTIDTSYLDQFSSNLNSPGNGIKEIQFNLLTMNVLSNNSTNVENRVADFVGSLATPLSTVAQQTLINIGTAGTYTDQSLGLPDSSGDTYPSGSNLPYIDMVSWSLIVTPP